MQRDIGKTPQPQSIQSDEVSENNGEKVRMKDVSVAVLCWNHEAFVDDCLTSIFSQEGCDFELIVIDNGSVDSSASRIRQCLQSFSGEFTFIENATNIGISSALNQALEKTHGEFFVAISADDAMMPGRLEHQVSLFKSAPTDVSVVASSCVCTDFDLNPTKQLVPSLPKMFDEQRIGLLQIRQPLAPSAMIRTEFLREAGGYDPQSPFEDYDLWVTLVFFLNTRMLSDERAVTLYRQHSNNASRNRALISAGLAYTWSKPLHHELNTRELRVLRRTVCGFFFPTAHDHLMAEGHAMKKKELQSWALRALFSRRLSLRQRLKTAGTIFFPAHAQRRLLAHYKRQCALVPPVDRRR